MYLHYIRCAAVGSEHAAPGLAAAWISSSVRLGSSVALVAGSRRSAEIARSRVSECLFMAHWDLPTGRRKVHFWEKIGRRRCPVKPTRTNQVRHGCARPAC